MTCSKCECLVRVKNKLGYNLYYCGYRKYGVLKALSGLYINNEEYRKNNKTCKYYKGDKRMTDEEKDRINRAEEIQRYTENRCETLEKENVKLKQQIEKMKCCTNCKHHNFSYMPYCCNKNNIAIHSWNLCDKWELAE